MNTDAGNRTIHILDPATVNQIAAGEVVERPASVVKELFENAIDAGARTIRVDLSSSKGSITTIQVIDNGIGMSPDDAVLAFTPHATSKIATIEDLDGIRTLGFRGEALASIAAVSRVTLCTKPHKSPAISGTKVVVEAGEIREHGEIGTPEGTNILVQDLFFNTPARKKFLKTLGTELAHITGIIEGLALAHPEISVFLTHNGKEIITTEQSSRLLDAIARLFGSDIVPYLIPVEHENPVVLINGYISRPSLFRKNLKRIIVSINGRYVSSSPINSAILEGYGTLLSKERFPVVFLFLVIDPALVDVNVHPAKKQVRLGPEREICIAVRQAISGALLRSDLIPAAQAPDNPFPTVQTGHGDAHASYDVEPGRAYGVSEPALEPTHAGIITTDRQLRQSELPTGILPDANIVPDMDVIGQIGGIYILAATRSGDLILVDQHAAHERIMYEMVSAKRESARQSQELIAPVLLHRSARDSAVLRELLPSLTEEGFEIEDFGKDTFLVRAVPVVLGALEHSNLVNEIVDDLSREDTSRSVSSRERITRIIACRSAIKAGTACTPEQCRRLLQQLRLAHNPFSCPHGRPTMVRFTREQLDAMFKRT
ncbi:MAG: DNA mismatch repair endonuclease MutL [Methanoregula sp.]|nr:MAG: DNA mismatch repair endonuclease MutL [Methanoregula sp.]